MIVNDQMYTDHELCHYLDGTATGPIPQLSALAKFIIVFSISDTLNWRVMECKTAFDSVGYRRVTSASEATGERVKRLT